MNLCDVCNIPARNQMECAKSAQLFKFLTLLLMMGEKGKVKQKYWYINQSEKQLRPSFNVFL
jgi:hypothetical protein